MLVSVITPTRNRARYIPGAVKCFLSQQLADKTVELEWVVLNNGEEGIEHLLPEDSRIRHIRIENPKQALTEGDLRNLCVFLAHGTIICNMDDDDWYAPNYLEVQMTRLINSRKQVSGFPAWYYWDEIKQVAYVRGIVPENHCGGGTQIFYKKWCLAHPYPHEYAPGLLYGTDSLFIREAHDQHQLNTFRADELIVVRRHNANTWPGLAHVPPQIDKSLLPAGFLQTF